MNIGLIFVDWLGALGIDARLVAGPGRSSSWACFGVSSPGEVAVGPRKIVGLAQARRRQGVLLSAGALVAPPPWGVLCDVMGRPAADAVDLAGGAPPRWLNLPSRPSTSWRPSCR